MTSFHWRWIPIRQFFPCYNRKFIFFKYQITLETISLYAIQGGIQREHLCNILKMLSPVSPDGLVPF